jgi:hypothetical protein
VPGRQRDTRCVLENLPASEILEERTSHAHRDETR